MPQRKAERKTSPALVPAEKDVSGLLEMFEFFLAERQLGKPIGALGESVRDLRLIVGRLLIDHFLNLSAPQEEPFCRALASMLADRAAALPSEDAGGQSYTDYCIGEIITPFEHAREIKRAHPRDRIRQKIFALDIPILRPFDYGLRGRLALVPSRKRKIRHGS